ncbi:MAG: phosphoribosylformylglycinamidine synthase subunit PurL [Planctomycetes bacterium]|nr:phosphoribosylformylglycinamidine synthase subunit PurL [Planctomycetota bacterium]
MLYKIRLIPKLGADSPESRRVARTLLDAGVHAQGIVHHRLFLLEGEFTRDDATRAATNLLADPVLERAEVFDGMELEPEGDLLFHVMRRTGVMDPIEASLLRALRDFGLVPVAVKSADQYLFASKPSAHDLSRTAAALGNIVVDESHHGPLKLASLPRGKAYTFERREVAIRSFDDEHLAGVNRSHGLALNAEEMRAVRDYFQAAKREPTDIELQTIAQTWSEHCKHKTLAGHVHYRERGREGQDRVEADSLFDKGDVPPNGRIDNLLKDTIKKATDDLAKPWCLSVFVDNAGVIEFDGQDAICFKVETHNHPSAIEPYGGAGTGIGGVIRDIMGTGLGARPILNTNVFCFGPWDLPKDAVPRGALHPRKVLRGVISGVRDYGNRMGIPTPNGSLHFEPRYTGNPLVYAGCVGLIPRDKIQKGAKPGDHIVVVGGRTGRDGIGGATFSSAELTSKSEVVSSGAVQIGNAIQEQMVLETLLKARDLGLYHGVTDCGAGGLSSAVGEMGEELGATVELSRVPIKYEGLSYLEIWISEAQERMVIAVPPHKVQQTLELFRSEDVEATDIGIFEQTGRLQLQWHGTTVADLSMEFLHGGMPKVWREALWSQPEHRVVRHVDQAPTTPGEILRAILASPNVCSKEWVVRQYDHEVQAGSAVKPFTGVSRDGPSDACAVVPKPGAQHAVVVSNGLNVLYGDVDPYWMALANIDEALRNYVATGGDIDHCAILDNFSWGNCGKSDRLAAMVRACYGALHAARAYGTPFISGKDSLNNEFKTEAGLSIAIPHTLLISAIGRAVSIDGLTTSDLKRAGNKLYMVGLTRKEFAASHHELVTGKAGERLVRTDADLALRCYRMLNDCQRRGLIQSAHDCAEGGLAVTLAEMCIGGRLGADVTLRQELAATDADIDDTTLLFSESTGRLVIEVQPQAEMDVRGLFEGLPLFALGEVSATGNLSIRGLNGNALVNEPVTTLHQAWRQPLYAAMGEEMPATTH